MIFKYCIVQSSKIFVDSSNKTLSTFEFGTRTARTCFVRERDSKADSTAFSPLLFLPRLILSKCLCLLSLQQDGSMGGKLAFQSTSAQTLKLSDMNITLSTKLKLENLWSTSIIFKCRNLFIVETFLALFSKVS